jgi:hypothetical protein
MGIIEYLVIALAVVVLAAVLGAAAIVYAAHFRWKMSRAVALMENASTEYPMEGRGLEGPLVC